MTEAQATNLSHARKAKHGTELVTKRSHAERQVRPAGVRTDSAEDRCRHPGGQDHLQKKKLQKELADLDKEARKIKTRLKAIERRRAELMKELDG